MEFNRLSVKIGVANTNEDNDFCLLTVLAIGTASTIPPQVVTTQHQSYELNVTSDTPVSVNDNATVAETEASVTTDAITTTATTTINTTTETLKRMC